MANNFETCRHILPHLGRILTQIAKRPSAAGALRLGLIHVIFARQVFGQWCAARNCARCQFDWWCHFRLADLQLFKLNSSWSIIASSRSELRPNCLRSSLAIIIFTLNLCPLGPLKIIWLKVCKLGQQD